jgi:glycosyltransferase involved in cell wall biosynthesis
MKIFCLRANENWICDRFVDEWVSAHQDSVTNNPHEADVLWLVASWCWNQLPVDLLRSKTVITTIHHLDLTKFDENQRMSFAFRDSLTDYYHVPCQSTKQQIEPFTSKEIFVQPFWVNQSMWKDKKPSADLRKKYGIPVNALLVGSFQRDTEGHDLKSPKLSKGPDIFCDIVEGFHQNNPNIQCVLSGWRRQYVMNRLDEAGIKYHYFEWADFKTLNDLYNCLDLYLVSSRCEGGPQAIVECAVTKTPLISTDVGLARYILSEESIISEGSESAQPNVDYAFEKVAQYLMPQGFKPFENFLEKVHEG